MYSDIPLGIENDFLVIPPKFACAIARKYLILKSDLSTIPVFLIF